MIEDIPVEDKIPDPRITGHVRQSFLVIDSKKYFEPFTALGGEKTAYQKSVYLAISGLQSIVSTATLPLTLVQDSICQRHFDHILIRKKIELIPAHDQVSAHTPEQREEMAIDQANSEMKAYLDSIEGTRFFRNEVVYELSRRLNSREVRTASHELLVQSLVSTWSVFESFSREFIVASVNDSPNLALPIMSSKDLKEFFGKQSIDLETITAHSFDLTNSMGEILFANRRLDSFLVLKKLYKALLNSAELQDALDAKMWELNQRRHLFVHRRGIVDASYIDQTGENLPKGSMLTITGYDIEAYLYAVRDTILLIGKASNEGGLQGH